MSKLTGLPPEYLFFESLFRNKIKLIFKKKRKPRKNFNFISSEQKKYWKYKAVAQKLAEERVAYFNEHYHYSFNRISIRNQKTRWGSCSLKKNLNFNWRIILLPDNLRDYLIIHELCHLKEMNHSLNFWKLVQEKVKDYKTRRKMIKQIRFP